MVQVRVSEGVLEGEVGRNEYGGEFCSFKGIPYAQPPLGDLRFKAPQPPKPWEGVRSAKEFGSQCYQKDIIFNTSIDGSEDCLYLNVYTPDVKPSKLLPVMFWIHGGGFMSGSGNDDFYGPEFLVREGVVLVTFNYRLEVLGFLCLDTEDVPGNAGMKDQVQALRWVQKNISEFGGDPDNVTIFGESAGGASVSFHLLSPMSKGLFKRAIAQSGAALLDTVMVFKPRERAFALGRQLGLFTDDVQELYQFLKKQPVESLVNIQVPILLAEKVSEDIQLFFNVVDEKQYGDNERFYFGEVLKNLKRGFHDGVDVMTGYTSEEGLLDIRSPETLEKKIYLAKNFPQVFVPSPLALTLPVNQQLEVGKKMRSFYFKNTDITVKDWKQFVNWYSTVIFVYAVIQSAKWYARKGKNNVYLYKFSCKSERNIISSVLGSSSIIGNTPATCHADDLLYMFNAKMIPTKVDPQSKTFEMINWVTKLWTNFAKSGNPTPDTCLGVKWLPYTEQNQDYLDIGNKLVPGSKPDADEIEFWENIYKEYAPNLV